MWPFLVLGVWVRAGQRISLSASARNPHQGLRTRFAARPEVEEGRKVPGKTERVSWQRRAEETCRREIAVQGKDGQQKEAVKDQLALLVAFVEVSRKIHAHDSQQMHMECKVSQNSLSFAWSWPKSVFIRLFFFFHPLGCILRICNEMCNIPSRKWGKTTRRITGDEKFNDFEIVGGHPVRGVITSGAVTRIKTNLRKRKRNHDDRKWFPKGKRKEKESREWMSRRTNGQKKMPIMTLWAAEKEKKRTRDRRVWRDRKKQKKINPPHEKTFF